MSQLPHLAKLVTDEQPAFGQFACVDDVNYLDALITQPCGKPLTKRAKQKKANQFCFISITHDRYVIGCAVINLKSVGSGFVYVYDKQTNTLVESHRLSPLAVHANMPSSPNTGKMSFKQAGLAIKLHFTEQEIAFRLKSKVVTVNAKITPSSSPLCLCTRTGYTGWVYMQKQCAMACSGTLSFSKKSAQDDVVLTKANCLAGIDWTLGYMTRETFWNWASINTHIQQDNREQTLGLNLSCGVNDTSYTENAVWVDDTLYNLPLTIFEYDQQDIMKPWRVHSNQQLPTDRQVNLTFTPKEVHSDHTDIKALASHFSQVVGTYSGKIVLPNQTIVLDDVWGLAEDHYAKW